MKRFLLKHYGAMLTGLALTLLALWLLLSQQSWIRGAVNRLDYLVYDLRLQATLGEFQREALDVIIVDIDEKSLKAHGRWPWSRLIIADLVVRLNQFGVKTIGLDIAFPEPERNPALELLQSEATEAAAEHQLEFLQALVPQMDRDTLLARALPGRNVVLGVMLLAEDAAPVGQLPPPWYFVKPGDSKAWQVPAMASYSSNLPRVQGAATDGGFLNATPRR